MTEKVRSTLLKIQTNRNVVQRALQIEPASRRVVVLVGLDIQSAMLEDRSVVSPRGRRQVDNLVAWEKLGQEGCSNPQGPRA